MEPWVVLGLVGVGIWILISTLQIVPEQEKFVVEEWGKFKRVLGPGLHIVIPIMQRVAYKKDLREVVVDVPPQKCITQDNVQVTVDGILYYKVVDAEKASYGIDSFEYATIQLAQTTMRSEIGKIELDRTFSERETINNSVVKSIDLASEPWGIKVTRYEIRDIEPSPSIIEAMESQVDAERRKRAEILESEGNKESLINTSKGEREEAINLSMGERQRTINEAEGQAQSMEIVAAATADGIRLIAEAIRKPQGRQALSLQIANQYIKELGTILESANISVLPLEVAQLQGLAQAILPQGIGASEAAQGLVTGFMTGKGGKTNG